MGKLLAGVCLAFLLMDIFNLWHYSSLKEGVGALPLFIPELGGEGNIVKS
jgi:hypothetical protein